MEPWEVEQLRRSVVMLPPGHSVGAMSREQALDLFAEVERSMGRAARYQAVLGEIRRVLEEFDSRGGGTSDS